MSARRTFLIREEVTRLQNLLGNNYPGYKVRAVTPVTKQLLLDGPFMFNGRMRSPKVKSIGAGVYEIWVDID